MNTNDIIKKLQCNSSQPAPLHGVFYRTVNNIRTRITAALAKEYIATHYGENSEFIKSFPGWDGATLSLGTNEFLIFEECRIATATDQDGTVIDLQGKYHRCSMELALAVAGILEDLNDSESALKHAREELKTSVSSEVWRAGRRDYEFEKERADAAEMENKELRAIFPKIHEALGIGACSPDCSIRALEWTPNHVLAALKCDRSAIDDQALKDRITKVCEWYGIGKDSSVIDRFMAAINPKT